MVPDNTVLIHHQDGLCEYRISRVRLTIQGGSLDLEISTERNPECSLGGLGSPTLYVESASVQAASPPELQREDVNVLVGWDTDELSKSDNIFRIYLGEHFALDNNVLAIERVNIHELRLRWEADCVDLNYYDERAKRNRVEAHATFRG
jgi:hypothetical protein